MGLQRTALCKDIWVILTFSYTYSCPIAYHSTVIGLGAVLYSCLLFEVQKPYSPNLDSGQIFIVMSCLPVISPKEINLIFGAIFLSCLVSELQRSFSSCLRPRTFSGLYLCFCYKNSPHRYWNRRQLYHCSLWSCNLCFQTALVLAQFFYRA
jgi:hypothetical protein